MSAQLTESSTAQLPASVPRLPQVVAQGARIRQMIDAARREGRTVGFVPTMGALHAGHASLIDVSRNECDLTVASVFVNPTQFAPNEDYRQYPRDLDRDLKLLGEHGCELVFAPSVEEMYPPGHATTINVGSVAEPFEGEIRPGHFNGVATIVMKLFQLVSADRAYFGQKDYQQSLVVRQMVVDLNVPIEIRVCPTVREADGLAMSSRNAYLSPDERRRSLALSQSLRLAEKLVVDGVKDTVTIRDRMLAQIQGAGGVDVQYIAFVSDGTVTPVTTITGPTIVAIAAKVGRTRLIDNLRLGN
jgi:pantoate--beta-alanine ligase